MRDERRKKLLASWVNLCTRFATTSIVVSRLFGRRLGTVMKSNSKLMRAAGRLWSNHHARYEEMCALAVTGQLGGAQMSELSAHISTCDSCREHLRSLAQVSVQVMPLLAGHSAPAADIVPPDGIRHRFLSRVAL